MKNKISYIIFGTVFILLIANVLLFAKTLDLQDKIGELENKTSKLDVENLDLTAQLSELQSINYITDVADKLKFKKKSRVLYLLGPEYALAAGHEKN